MAVGSAGCIAAFANVFPKSIVGIYDSYREGDFKEALELQQCVALAEQACKAGGVAAIKYAAGVFTSPIAGIKGEGVVDRFNPRRPYLPLSEGQKKAIVQALNGMALTEHPDNSDWLTPVVHEQIYR